MKPLRESTSANSIKAQNEKEIEALRKKVNYQSTEYDKLLEKLNSSEHECKNYQTKIANLEKKNKLLRNSNNDLNVELKGMSIMKNEIEEKNQEIGRLQATIIEKGKQQESSWATGLYKINMYNKMGCAFPMVVISLLFHVDFGPNDY
jgi:predicted RNase H-like nuclease (RuvC/YqgF family)